MFQSIKDGFRHKLRKTHESYYYDPKRQAKHRAILFGSLAGLLLLIVGSIGTYMVTYGDRAAPATFLAGVDVSGKSEYEIKKIAEDQFNKIKLTLTSADVVVKTDLEELGITLDANKTFQDIINSGNELNIFLKFSPFAEKNNRLAVKYDKSIIQDYLNEKFYSISKPPTEPVVAYKDELQLFEVVPGFAGKIISVNDVLPIIEKALDEPSEIIKKLDLADTEPVISDKTAGEARDFMNKRLDLRINMYHDGRLYYFVDPPDIASFAEFTVNESKQKFDISFSDGKIKTFLDQKVAPSLSGAPVDKILLVDKKGETLMTIREGKKGLAPSNTDYLIEKIKKALTENATLDTELDLKETPYKTEKVVTEDNRWIEYNLSNFTVTLWDGKTKVWSTNNTANGKPSTPTITGIFRVFSKITIQTMTGGTAGTGDYYSIPGVKWVTYWGPGGYAFHTASWLGGQERTRISHGCVNMHEADAKTVFDFSEIGTKVVTHW
ncbi:MAG: L,D-transpeptidase/peptidoglycan binding protein [Candidatus Nomurabacteria bacterium]|nr:L,D-transpeptidase/peptidoglycan binding protein [Candidatus Nomurabacteria bacterium]